MLIDTHCHLSHERYASDLPDVLNRAASAGVGGVVSIASTLDDAADLRRLLTHLPEAVGMDGPPRCRVARTAGVHPHHAAEVAADLRPRLLDELARDPRPVAVGECGLDFHYDFAPPQAQRAAFQLQIEVAAETGLPLVVHCREAEAEMMPMVKEAGASGVRGVLHCFPGDMDLLETAMEAGWMVSFTGLVTFRSFDGLDAVRRVPDDRYMLETDGPYMAPAPHRGKRNEPAFVPRIRDRVAELRGQSAEAVASTTTANARAFFPELGF
ncbi:MAG: TatD family deoxyribonuclease [Gemmatimonadales bacterium]|nr:MAG: TatD family deoxyribonuclease [Gemmatimonadales bacterium]